MLRIVCVCVCLCTRSRDKSQLVLVIELEFTVKITTFFFSSPHPKSFTSNHTCTFIHTHILKPHNYLAPLPLYEESTSGESVFD